MTVSFTAVGHACATNYTSHIICCAYMTYNSEDVYLF